MGAVAKTGREQQTEAFWEEVVFVVAMECGDEVMRAYRLVDADVAIGYNV